VALGNDFKRIAESYEKKLKYIKNICAAFTSTGVSKYHGTSPFLPPT
jgi:hypothetical protein